MKMLSSEAKPLSEMSLSGRKNIKSLRMFLNTYDKSCSIEVS